MALEDYDERIASVPNIADMADAVVMPPVMDDLQRMVAVTDRTLCERPLVQQVRRVCQLHPAAVVLREKDLDATEYEHLARQVAEVCDEAGVPCVLHSFVEVALRLGIAAIHLPLPQLQQLAEKHPGQLAQFEHVGCSVHSVNQALVAVQLGADTLIAGHVFETECKPGFSPRGLDFLRSVCAAVDVPVYAIGGFDLNDGRLQQALSVGAAGACARSAFMRV